MCHLSKLPFSSWFSCHKKVPPQIRSHVAPISHRAAGPGLDSFQPVWSIHGNQFQCAGAAMGPSWGQPDHWSMIYSHIQSINITQHNNMSLCLMMSWHRPIRPAAEPGGLYDCLLGCGGALQAGWERQGGPGRYLVLPGLLSRTGLSDWGRSFPCDAQSCRSICLMKK